jgi:hypothetical protein
MSHKYVSHKHVSHKWTIVCYLDTDKHSNPTLAILVKKLITIPNYNKIFIKHLT